MPYGMRQYTGEWLLRILSQFIGWASTAGALETKFDYEPIKTPDDASWSRPVRITRPAI